MSITINGIMYKGSCVVVSNGKVFVDGIDLSPKDKNITINVEGPINSISADYCEKIIVTGNVLDIKTLSGDVDVRGNVSGSISTMSGHVACGNVGGSVQTMSGNVKRMT